MKKAHAIFVLSLIIGSFLFVLHCGSSGSPTSSSSGGGTGTSGTSGVAISGSVAVPQSTSTSVSVGSSVASVSRGVSKSVAKGGDSENRIIVYKTVSDVPASTGTVIAKKLDGTVLDTGVIGSDGSISGVIVDPTQVDSTNQVLLEATVGTKKVTSLVDLTGKVTGQTASAGTVNTDSTLSVQQVYYQGDPNCTPDNPSACASKFASGEIKPKALFKIFKSSCEDSSTSAGSSNAASSSKAVCQAFRAAMAAAPVSFSEMNSAFQDSNILSRWGANDSSLAGIPWNTAHGNFQKFGPAIVKTFEDSTTFNKYNTAGDTGWESSFKYFGGMTGTELQNGVDHPAVFQGYMVQNATAYINGDTTAFNAMKQPGVAKLIGQMAGKFSGTFGSGQFEAMKSMMDSQASKFNCTDSTTCAQQGEALFNQLASATSTTTLDMLKANPGTFIDKWVAHPGEYTGAAGQTIFNNQFTTYVQNPTGFTDENARGCSTDLDCPAGAPTCTPIKMCMASCSSNCGFGSKCTTNANCATNYCSSDGLCNINPTLVNAGGGSMFTQMHGPGGSCNFTYECFPPLTCSSGTCSGFTNWGGISYASGLGAVTGDQQITLNWTKTSGATGYKIYRSSSGDGTYTLLATVGDVATYVNTGLSNGTTYYYKISSLATGGESTLSALVGATPSSTAVQLAGVVTNFVGPPQGTITTGSTNDTTSGDGHLARFSAPVGLCITPNGAELYVMDKDNNVIRKVVIATRVVSLFAGQVGASDITDGTGTNARFRVPFSCTIDPSGNNMYVTDNLAHTIRKVVLATAQVTTLAGIANTSGNLNHTTGTAAKFNGPLGIVINSLGNTLYVSELNNNDIRKINITTSEVSLFAGDALGTSGNVNGIGSAAKFDTPAGLTADSTSTNLYVADMNNNVIRKIVIATQEVSTVFTTALVSIVVDPTNTYLYGTTYMLSTHLVKRIIIGGSASNFTTVAGQSGVTGDTNGTGTSALFNDPASLVFDPTGTTLYIADSVNNKIRQIQ